MTTPADAPTGESDPSNGSSGGREVAPAGADPADLGAALLDARTELARRSEELAEVMDARTHVLATMSHELRTPLNAVLGYAGLLRDGVYGALAPEQSRAVQAIIRRTHDLQQLIDDVLDLASLDAGRAELRLGTFDPTDVVNEARHSIAARAAEKSLSVIVRYELRRPVYGDRARYRRILTNLASNAVKFTPPGGEVEITLADGGNGTFITRLRDTGIGIPPEQLGRIFDGFRQLERGPTRRFAGIGVGLALARRSAELMGGTLAVESTVDHGTTVVLRLPISADARVQGAAVDEPVAGVSTDAPVVLAIDDDPEVIALLRDSLAPAGFRVVGALNGDRGIELARILNPVVILLDIMMPRKDGWQVLREIKADRTLHHVPVVVMSIVAERALGLSMGVADYLVKPVDRRVLLDVLRRVRERRAAHRAVVLEEDDDSRTLLCDLLESLGYTVRVAQSASGALALLRTEAPDVLFLDTALRGDAVRRVLDALAAEETLRGVSVVLLTHGGRRQPPLPDSVDGTLLDTRGEHPDQLLRKLRAALDELAVRP
ncbi:MAG TPA: response regulator [Gemmatimonadaceae bacterium]|nr:response regulator [Gemmatimonadaceae bacterium]